MALSAHGRLAFLQHDYDVMHALFNEAMLVSEQVRDSLTAAMTIGGWAGLRRTLVSRRHRLMRTRTDATQHRVVSSHERVLGTGQTDVAGPAPQAYARARLMGSQIETPET